MRKFSQFQFHFFFKDASLRRKKKEPGFLDSDLDSNSGLNFWIAVYHIRMFRISFCLMRIVNKKSVESKIPSKCSQCQIYDHGNKTDSRTTNKEQQTDMKMKCGTWTKNDERT